MISRFVMLLLLVALYPYHRVFFLEPRGKGPSARARRQRAPGAAAPSAPWWGPAPCRRPGAITATVVVTIMLRIDNDNDSSSKEAFDRFGRSLLFDRFDRFKRHCGRSVWMSPPKFWMSKKVFRRLKSILDA